MAADQYLHQESIDRERRQHAVDIAVLKEQVAALASAMADMKVVNSVQTQKIDLMLEKMAEARGGMATLLKFGGAAAALGAALSWVVDHFVKAFIK